MRNPSANYNRLDTRMWQDKLEAELRASGLPEAILKLTKLVDSTRVNALLSEADTVIKQLREMRIVYECVLLRCGIPSSD